MVINKKKIFDILQSTEVDPLESDVEIEDIILVIKDIDSKISFLERLKRDRTKSISNEIEKLLLKKDKFKDVISKTLEKFNHKALNFPGVGRVVSKISSGKWEVIDEAGLIDALKEKLDAQTFSEVVVQKQSIVKKELNKVLEQWVSEGNKIDSAKKEKDEPSLMITYDKSNTDTIETEEYNMPSINPENYDQLDDKKVDF